MEDNKRKFVIPDLTEKPAIVQNHFQAGKIMGEIKKSALEKDERSLQDAKLSVAEQATNTKPETTQKILTSELPNNVQQAPQTKKAEDVKGKSSCIFVNPKQKGNPLLKHIRNVPWEFSEIEPDYIMGQTVCALFLSLRYFNLYPQYIHERLKSLGKNYQLRVLLIQIDVSDPYPALKDLSRIAILTDCTLLLAWSFEEAGKCIETFKVFENKSPDMIMEKLESDTYVKLIDSISSVKSVNKTDALTLLTTFGTMERLFAASPEELSLCPGMGFLKAKRLCDVLQQPFILRK